MFLLGEYCEDEARELADRLKEVGMKVEIRTYISSRMEISHFLEGRMSEMKSELDEDAFQIYERYFAALRKVLGEGARPDDFKERFQLAVDPQYKEKQKQFQDIMEADESEGEYSIIPDSSSGIIWDIIELSNAESFVNLILERNKIQIGEDIGDKLDDPIWRVINDTNEYNEDESDLTRTTTIFSLEPRAQVFVDEFYTVLVEVMDEDFEEDFPEEYMRLVLVGKLISELKEPAPGWMSMEQFQKRCKVEMDDDGNLLEIDGRSSVNELAKVMEKNGIIKTKGARARWKT
ncbi:MAG TPA: hypothetical protein PKX20_06410 [Methanothrix soehngenii]|nr:hypothetical protein [Methanothrix soehngenii]